MIEPSLNGNEAKSIERLISIYMNLNPTKRFNLNDDTMLNDSIVHTFDECLQKNPHQVDKPLKPIENSIWREAPGLTNFLYNKKM